MVYRGCFPDSELAIALKDELFCNDLLTPVAIKLMFAQFPNEEGSGHLQANTYSKDPMIFQIHLLINAKKVNEHTDDVVCILHVLVRSILHPNPELLGFHISLSFEIKRYGLK